MMISIITICFNDKVGLERTIQSVLKQTYQGFEYIIIDGGSTDGSIEFIKENSEKITYWISESDSGVYNAMNKGIKKAKGEYLLFLNSGDAFINNEVLLKVFSEIRTADFVYGDLMVNASHRIWLKTYPKELTFQYFLKDTLPHPATFIRREIFARCGLYNEDNKIVSDWEFFMLSIAKHNCSYQHLSIPISEFMYNGISSKVENRELIFQEKRKALSKHFQVFLRDYKELERLQINQNSRAFKWYNKIKAYLFYK